MKKYIRTVTVMAEPMTLDKAEKKAGHKFEFNHDGETKGYLVQNNGMTGFRLKDDFEKEFRCVESFLDRLLVERDELSERLSKLRAFTQTPWFDSVSNRNKVLMEKQEQAMSSYLTILTARIELAKEEEKK